MDEIVFHGSLLEERHGVNRSRNDWMEVFVAIMFTLAPLSSLALLCLTMRKKLIPSDYAHRLHS